MKLPEFINRVLAIKDKLYRFALRITGQGVEAEDVVQDVLLQIWNKREEREQLNNLEAFCMQMTRNLSIDRIRNKNYGHQDLEHVPETATPQQTPQEVTEQKDTLAHIRQILDNLPIKQKMVLQLRDIEGMTYQEIADALEISVNQVKVYLFRARTAIREQILALENYGL